MKIKEIDVTANIAWSPNTISPVRLAAGTAAQQLDATFSTNSALEIYDLNLGDESSSMTKIGSIPTENRFHKIVWGQGGVVNSENNRYETNMFKRDRCFLISLILSPYTQIIN